MSRGCYIMVMALIFIAAFSVPSHASMADSRLYITDGTTPVRGASVTVTDMTGLQVAKTQDREDKGFVIVPLDTDRHYNITVTTRDNRTKTFTIKAASTATLDMRQGVAVAPPPPPAAAIAARPSSAAPATSGSRGEWYVAALIGINFPGDFTNVEGTGINAGVKLDDMRLKTSLAYELKTGYYFPKIFSTNFRVGGELAGNYSNPHVKQQVLTGTINGTPIVPIDQKGYHTRVFKLAYHLLLRYDGSNWLQPYIGVGPGIFWGRLSNVDESTSDTSFGLSAIAGLRWLTPLPHVGLWAEYGYDRTSFDFGAGHGANPTDLSMDYRAHQGKIGVSYYLGGDQGKW
jgi:opacity protein-like surface antigen